MTALQARAAQRLRSIRRRRRDPRYQQVMGRFVAAGLLRTNESVPEHREPVDVRHVIWAGQVEPRLVELLPALIVKKPSLFIDPKDMPDESR